ncbi:ABC transporter permease [Pollutimonas bauzanensis]|jgi:ABC-type spermidine/putrescine transport system permease subunit I|uniref:ABC transporter permease n=1 Tax=Pollutimonas bauzanensis TaxID=658167 RepID=UPI0033416D39
MTELTASSPLDKAGATSRHVLDQPWLLLTPLLGLLVFVFFLPIGWFLFQAISESDLSLMEQLNSVLLSPDISYVLWNTNLIALIVTLTVLLMAYPIAYVLAYSNKLFFTLIIISVIVPYFTSVVVRTYSWMVLLGRNGILNQLLLNSGVIDQPLELMYNRTGVIIGMSYVLLPYLVLTLFSAMKGIDYNLIRAAQSMGASGTYTFLKVFLPLSMPGLISGCLIVFILAIGFFITPALMGGAEDVMIAMLIQREIELNLNWPVAAMLSLALLAVTLVLYAIYYRYTNLDRMLGK